jgi:hypothetical protein
MPLRQLTLIVLLALCCSAPSVSQAYDFSLSRDYAFERGIAAIDPSCMPEPDERTLMSNSEYLVEVVRNIANECSKISTNPSSREKYMILLTISGIPSPLAPAGVAIASAEAGVDLAKCTARALIDSSELMLPESRALWKERVEKLDFVYDWFSVLKNLRGAIPELAALPSSKFTPLHFLIDLASESPERFEEIVSAASSAADGALIEVLKGLAYSSLNYTEQDVKNCLGDTLKDSFLLTKEAAQTECNEYGRHYRLKERERELYGKQNYRQFINKSWKAQEIYTPQQDKFAELSRELNDRRGALDNISKIFKDIDKLERSVNMRLAEYKYGKSRFKEESNKLFEAPTAYDACMALPNILPNLVKKKDLTQACGKSLAHDPEILQNIAEIALELNNAPRVLSNAFWNTNDQLRAASITCNSVNSLLAEAEKLQKSVANTPMALYENGQCKEIDQQRLKSHVAGIRNALVKKRDLCVEPADTLCTESGQRKKKALEAQIVKKENQLRKYIERVNNGTARERVKADDNLKFQYVLFPPGSGSGLTLKLIDKEFEKLKKKFHSELARGEAWTMNLSRGPGAGSWGHKLKGIKEKRVATQKKMQGKLSESARAYAQKTLQWCNLKEDQWNTERDRVIGTYETDLLILESLRGKWIYATKEKIKDRQREIAELRQQIARLGC